MRRSTLIVAALLEGIAPPFNFTAIALGLVGCVTARCKLRARPIVMWAWPLLGEGMACQRLLGRIVLLLGSVLVTTTATSSGSVVGVVTRL